MSTASGSTGRPTSRRRCGIRTSSACTIAASSTANCGSRWTTSTAPTPAGCSASGTPTACPRDEVAEIVTAVADALDYAHQRKLLHRDVKPANILLANPQSDGQRILLADFGIARWADDPSGLTATNMTVGTVSYAAPEQLMGGHARRSRRPVCVGRHRVSSLDGLAAVPAHEPGRRHQPAPSARRRPPSATGARNCRRSTRYWPRRWRRTPTTASRGAATSPARSGTGLAMSRPMPTRLSPAVADPPKAGRSPLRPAVVVPAVLAILLVAAIGFALLELNRADDERPASPARTTAVTSAPTAVPSSVPSPASSVTPLPPPPEAAAVGARDDGRNHDRNHDVFGPGCARRGDRRRLLAGRQHGHHRQRLDGLLLDAAEHQRNHLVVEPGRGAEPDGDHGTDRRAVAHRGGVAGTGVHAADRPDPQAMP